MASWNKLTDRQRDILKFIGEHIRDIGYPPTIREIGIGFDISSPNGVDFHLKALQKKGYIERDKHTSRGIRIVPQKPAAKR